MGPTPKSQISSRCACRFAGAETEFQLREGRSARPPRGQSRRQLRGLRITSGELTIGEPRRPAHKARLRLGSRQTGRSWGAFERESGRECAREEHAACAGEPERQVTALDSRSSAVRLPGGCALALCGRTAHVTL